jgi:hypothetical protein
MKQNLTALLSGLLVGVGLAMSQMIDRERILGFLDFAGAWDPTLLFVLAGAIGVTTIAFRFILPMERPLVESRFYLPTRRDVDRPLILGSAIFGIGWGIAGYCPGPGLSALLVGGWNPLLFVVSVIGGSLAYKWVSEQNVHRHAIPEPQRATPTSHP